tara:strand:+ start:329 stop:646 length:318 start_codon:yes stop_codon:yes gene_type:complete
MTDHRAALGISGIIITLYNIYWLVKFDFRWNIFTSESFFMLPVGVILATQLFMQKDSKFGRGQNSESTHDIGEQSDLDKQRKMLDMLLVILAVILVVLLVFYFGD